MSHDATFLDQVASPRFCERLFAHLPDVVFCLKDADRRYQAANMAFAARLGLRDPRQLLGMRAEDFFPSDLADVYREQDLDVLANGREISDQLELVSNSDGSLGWYLATKVPLRDAAGRVIGLASISRDLRTPRSEDLEFEGLQMVVARIRNSLDEDLRPAVLAKGAGMSLSQLERRMRKVFQLTTSQFIRQSRINHALHLLRSTALPLAEVALECGYGDQTAFTRQFRQTVGMPPGNYRERARVGSVLE
ncbi:MAG: helix-turn-helix domain-containing protein [Luteolibacter sp.]